MTRGALRRDLARVRNKKRATFVARFFKTQKGQYAYGDVFNGASVPACRTIAKTYRTLPERDVLALLTSRIHEERLIALVIFTHQFQTGDERTRARIVRLYLRNVRHINNWDLVDISAPYIVGAYLLNKKRTILRRMAHSPHLWTRRIAIVATHAFIREGETAETLRIAHILRNDPHDLIHKATGWMLREVGKKDLTALRGFLKTHAPHMPRTMLRYAIERMSTAERKRWMSL